MNTILAAAALPTLHTAKALARTLRFPVVVLHVREDGVEPEHLQAAPRASSSAWLPADLRRILVPLDGTTAAIRAVEQTMQPFAGSRTWSSTAAGRPIGSWTSPPPSGPT